MRAVLAIATLLAITTLSAKAADAVAEEADAVVQDQHTMSYREMADTMKMDDTARFGKVMFDQLEWRDGGAGEGRAAWDAQGYYGGDYDKLWIKTEGKYVSGGRDATGAGDSGIRDADVE